MSVYNVESTAHNKSAKNKIIKIFLRKKRKNDKDRQRELDEQKLVDEEEDMANEDDANKVC